jgi:signal transduction histidine kinase
MKRPWQVWLLFATCVLGVLAGMAWLTQQALRADERRRAAEAEAELDKRVNSALWRMDTELAPIIAEEVIRPTSAFRPNGAAVKPPQFVLMQFEARDKGFWSTPQISSWRSYVPQLDDLRTNVDFDRLLAQLPETPLPLTVDADEKAQEAKLAELYARNTGESNPFEFVEGNRIAQPAAPESQNQEAQPAQQPAPNGPGMNRSADFEQRNKRYQSAAQQSLINSSQRGGNSPPIAQAPAQQKPQKQAAKAQPEQVGVSRPVWVGDRLILARRVSSGGQTFVQGSWLDWPKLKTRLLGETTDLLPKADLVPVNGDGETDPGRMLAGLPVKLTVSETIEAGMVSPALRWALTIGWGAVLLAVGVAAFLLQGVMTLSERRAAFVSSVTHELRTPLTTFRMYAEMLAKGMVPDANRRQEYFNTLQREAERLTLLVENVLAYARLERGRRPQAQDHISLAALLERVGPRLKQRAAQAGMQCELQLDGNAAHQEFTTDQAVVEQILFNLVDNAAKYAREATDRRIHVEANRNGQFVHLVVRDHGPGIKDGLWSRPMQPFGKSAQESAESAPGVGLGLALCRRLARQLGGRLDIASSADGGAALTLLLPYA